jgi:hypothetical protein
MSQLQLENDALKHQLAVHRVNNIPAGQPAAAVAVRGGPQTDLLHKISTLEEELKQTKARLAIAGEASELSSLLKQGDNVHSVVRNFYPDESVFVGKHQYLRESAKAFDDDGSTSIGTVLGQYDLIVVGYQALYRQLRQKYEATRAKAFDPMHAAKSIIPSEPVRLVDAQRVAAPSVHRASPMRWKDLDRAPSADMRGTGTLADPLLTDTGRIELRARLAAQMRGSARNYTPTRPTRRTASPARTLVPAHSHSHSQSHSYSREGSPAPSTLMTSQAAMARLQTMTGRAVRNRQLES